MMRSLALSLLVLGVVATTAAAQPPGTTPGQYDPNIEGSYSGIVTSVISVTGPDGTVGVHLNLKTATGTIVRVHLGPAVFIGMNNFFFYADDLIVVRGAYVSHDGEVALWARQVSKEGKMLTLRSPDGTPQWPVATADDPDGCGVSHAPMQF
jgi:hypothetical protein